MVGQESLLGMALVGLCRVLLLRRNFAALCRGRRSSSDRGLGSRRSLGRVPSLGSRRSGSLGRSGGATRIISAGNGISSRSNRRSHSISRNDLSSLEGDRARSATQLVLRVGRSVRSDLGDSGTGDGVRGLAVGPDIDHGALVVLVDTGDRDELRRGWSGGTGASDDQLGAVGVELRCTRGVEGEDFVTDEVGAGFELGWDRYGPGDIVLLILFFFKIAEKCQ